MKAKTFINSDLIKILDLTQRQVIDMTEKGLIVPKTEARGAGTKREYDYGNLLEFALCKRLYDFGLAYHRVKQILKDLRIAGELRKWAEGYQNGILVYLYIEPEHFRYFVTPGTMTDLLENITEKTLKDFILSGKAMGIFNLGEIKKEIDVKLKELGY